MASQKTNGCNNIVDPLVKEAKEIIQYCCESVKSSAKKDSAEARKEGE